MGQLKHEEYREVTNDDERPQSFVLNLWLARASFKILLFNQLLQRSTSSRQRLIVLPSPTFPGLWLQASSRKSPLSRFGGADQAIGVGEDADRNDQNCDAKQERVTGTAGDALPFS